MSDRHEIEGAFNTRNPPSNHAMDQLRWIASHGTEGIPSQVLNFTVRDKLLAFGYVYVRAKDATEWYASLKAGSQRDFLFITDKGREALRS